MKDRYVIIMAGGIGSRFWPLSRSSKPKQFLDILGTGETLIQQTFNRFKDLCPPDNIFVVTSNEHKGLVLEQLEIRPDRILSEPLRKNTAPCIAYGTLRIIKEKENAVITVTPADLSISNMVNFQKVINSGYDFAKSHEALITVGIRPNKPETGYGYIQADKESGISGVSNLFKVKSFTEKPDLKLANFFLESGDFFWNSGIFIWKAKTILKAFNDYLPDLISVFHEGFSVLGTPGEPEFIERVYPSFESISVDYGILEKTTKVFILTEDIGWSDLGTWSSLYAHSKTDNEGNAIVRGEVFTDNCKDNMISITPGKTVLLNGLNDFIIVDTDDALLVIKKDREQEIKQFLEEIKSYSKK